MQLKHQLVSAAVKVLGRDPDPRQKQIQMKIERHARAALHSNDAFVEPDPSVRQSIKDFIPSRYGFMHYFVGLLPIASWIGRYNYAWLLRDVAAGQFSNSCGIATNGLTIVGITAGLVIVPQAIAYSSLADLSPSYGLYTAFSGAVTYWCLGTSRDIIMGATAVGALLVGDVVNRVSLVSSGVYSHEEIARLLTIICGIVHLVFGLLNLGWIIEFIPHIPVSAFITAAGVTIMATQVPTALGIEGINTRMPPYKVFAQIVTRLSDVTIDASIGVTCVILLFAIRGFCSTMEARQPAKRRMWALISSLRMTFTMLLFILLSYIVNHGTVSGAPRLKIVGKVKPGVPLFNKTLVKNLLPKMPAVVIIMMIRHISIARAMSRLSKYSINPSQEVIALGAANVLSAFLGGFVCTASFSASAVMSKAGVATPMSGLLAAGIILLALYVLASVFYFLPNAALAGLIIHAVCNLIERPSSLYKYWRISPIEFFIWVACVATAIIVSLEASIYAGCIISLILLLLRVARTRGTFLGQLQVRRVVPESKIKEFNRALPNADPAPDVYFPLDKPTGTNPNICPQIPYPGIIIYRFNENYSYVNQARHVDSLLEYVIEHTRSAVEIHDTKKSDKLWNDDGKSTGSAEAGLPLLRAVILDMAAVNHVDVTSVQGLVSLREFMNERSSPDTVEWHFANVHGAWSRRALSAAGFGVPSVENADLLKDWSPTYMVAETKLSRKGRTGSEECMYADVRWQNMAAIGGVNLPFFHLDLHDAVESAIRSARNKDDRSVV